MAAREQAIRTNLIKAKIDKTQQESKCRMCGQADESVNHILSECSKMAQKEYKRRHDWVGKKVHWEVSKRMSQMQSVKTMISTFCGILKCKQTM